MNGMCKKIKISMNEGAYKVTLQKNYISVDEMRNARIISLTRGSEKKRNKKLCLAS